MRQKRRVGNLLRRIATWISWLFVGFLVIAGVIGAVGGASLELDSFSPLWTIGPIGWFFPYVGCPSAFTVGTAVALYLVVRLVRRITVHGSEGELYSVRQVALVLVWLYVQWSVVFFCLTTLAHMVPDAFQGWR
jgi:hypothetical protein